MPKQIVIAEQHHIAAVFWEDQIQELIVSTGNQQVGDIYLGIVENVIPGIDAAFVNIGDAERNGFMHVGDLGPLRLKESAGAITELLSPQQNVLVQVMKEPTGNKGPRLTGNVSLPGRYLVLMPYGRGVNLSRRIKNENERSRLRALAILVKPAGMGILVRTEAEGKAEEAIMEDLEQLQQQWESILNQASNTRAPALLNRDDDFIQRVLRDVYTADVNRIVIDSQTGVKRIKQQLMNWSSGRSPEGVLIDQHRDRLPILEYFRVNAAIREALKPRVELPSGGYVIIEPTEALTVIDVNSGSFTHSATSRETVLWTNCEAATEIARQLRLRNIGGVIVVDFIDMDSRRDQLQLLNHFNKALKGDKARPQIAQLSELGLVELTRKRQGQNIYELFGHACPSCGGLGHLVHLPDREPRELMPVVSTTPQPTGSLRPIPASERKTEEFDALLDIVGEESEQDLDLLHHPSYQEPTGTTSRRRSRRHQRISDTIAKDVSKSKARSTPAPIPVSQAEETTERPIINRNGRRDRDQESKSKNYRQKPEPETITVEMSPLEQEIYALMGISPLLRTDKEVKNPKSVVLNVKSPGETEDTDSAPEFSDGKATSSATATLIKNPKSETVTETSEVPTDTAEETQEDTEKTDDSDRTRRRRRRRSSSQNS
jgi:ribonuclease E